MDTYVFIKMKNKKRITVTGLRLLLHQRNIWLRMISYLQTTFSGRQWQWDFLLQEECLVHYVSIYFRWLWPVQTSTNQFRPVTGAHNKKRIGWLVMQLLIQTLTKEVVQFRLSRLKLSVILPTHALNYCVQKWEKCIKYLEISLFV